MRTLYGDKVKTESEPHAASKQDPAEGNGFMPLLSTHRRLKVSQDFSGVFV
jgi:hypothetical protein